MLNRIFGKYTHDYLHVLGISGLAFGLPLNKVMMSISMLFIILNLLLEANFKSYYNNLKNNKLYLLGLGYFALHVIGLAWTNDFTYGFHDLRVILPLLVILTGVSAKPINSNHYLNIILISFLGSILLTSFINFGSYQHWFGTIEYDDIRGLSLFGSHVRYGLLIATGASISIHFILQKEKRILFLTVLMWLFFYTYYSQVLSGLFTLTGVLLTYILFHLFQKNKWIAFGGLSLIMIIITMITIWVIRPISYDPAEYQNLPSKTAEGNTYLHSLREVSPETGKPIDIFVCDKELKREWEKVSSFTYYGEDIKGQLIRSTIIRYLASKGLKKDAAGFTQLTQQDIKNIEHGEASVYNRGILARVYSIQMQLNNYGDPNGHSLLERIEYWKIGLQIAKENWIIGVGTGDVQLKFDEKYESNKTLLLPEKRHRSHNMYLTVLISFGVFGLFLFLWMHFEFLHQMILKNAQLAVTFIVIILLSYTIEDTLETQMGITFFALFYSLFGSGNIKK